MGPDAFQKKDPFGWIGGDAAEGTEKSKGLPGHPSNPDESSEPGKHSARGPPNKAGNPSKHDLPSPLSSPGCPSAPSTPSRGTTTFKGLRPGWTRATFIVREETLQKLKAVAYWDRKELKRVVEEALAAYLQAKDLPPIPEESSHHH